MVRGVEDLRTRIGEVLRVGLQGSHEDGFDTEEVLALADAVVRELHPEYRCELCGRSGTQKFREMGTGWVCRSVSACDRRANR